MLQRQIRGPADNLCHRRQRLHAEIFQHTSDAIDVVQLIDRNLEVSDTREGLDVFIGQRRGLVDVPLHALSFISSQKRHCIDITWILLAQPSSRPIAELPTSSSNAIAGACGQKPQRGRWDSWRNRIRCYEPMPTEVGQRSRPDTQGTVHDHLTVAMQTDHTQRWLANQFRQKPAKPLDETMIGLEINLPVSSQLDCLEFSFRELAHSLITTREKITNDLTVPDWRRFMKGSATTNMLKNSAQIVRT